MPGSILTLRIGPCNIEEQDHYSSSLHRRHERPQSPQIGPQSYKESAKRALGHRNRGRKCVVGRYQEVPATRRTLDFYARVGVWIEVLGSLCPPPLSTIPLTATESGQERYIAVRATSPEDMLICLAQQRRRGGRRFFHPIICPHS